MAKFNTHLSFGFILAVAGAVCAIIFSLVSNNFFLAAVAAGILVGSLLPDLDSDGGLPFKVTFWMAAVICAGMTFLHLFRLDLKDPLQLIGFPLASFFFTRYVLGWFFRKITHHRGMFHSLPAAAIAGLVTFLFLKPLEISLLDKQSVGLAVCLGYLGHLVLDEIHATIDFKGLRFWPKRSLGSALKLFSSSTWTNLLSYGLLFFLSFSALS